MKMPSRICIAVLASTALASAHGAPFGDPDPTFASPALPPQTFCEYSIGATGDADAYVAVWGNTIGVTKVRKDGTLDTGWGMAGLAGMPGIPEHGGGTMHARGFLPTADGGVIVVGHRLVKLTRAGARDTSFGFQGVSDPIAQAGFIESFALQPDGSVVVLARGFNGGPLASFTRIAANGRRDSAFGVGGVVSFDALNVGIYGWSVHDGEVEYGTYPHYSSGPVPLRLYRASVSGNALVINAGGRIVPSPGLANWISPNLQVQPDGGVLLAVATCNDAQCTAPAVSVQRYRADGAPDATFAEGGRRSLTPFASSANLVRTTVLPRMLSIGQGGSITVLVHGEQTSGGFFPAYLYRADHAYRLSLDGKLDPAFDNGKVLGGGSYTRYLQIDDGRLVATPQGECAERLTSDVFRMNVAIAEYYQPQLGHYFITGEGLETGVLDANQAADRWVRTGWTFGGWLAFDLPGTKRVCRFHGDVAAGPNSHFFTLEGPECDFLKGLDAATPGGRAAWRFEGYAFSAVEPTNGLCPTNLVPVYRAYNRGFEQGGVPNHRYSADLRVHQSMQASGWAAEGVKLCVPPASDAVSSLSQ